MLQNWSKSSQEKLQLDKAGITDEVLDTAMQAFILEVMDKHRSSPKALQQGPLHPQVPGLTVMPVPQLQVPADGAGPQGLQALHDLSQSHHHRLQPQQLPRLPHQVEQDHRGDIRPLHGCGQGQVPANTTSSWCCIPGTSLKLILHFLCIVHHKDLIGKPSGYLPAQDPAIHRPGHHACESGSTPQVDRSHPWRCGKGHGPHAGWAQQGPQLG
ncbi:PREDICTED: uncharacterized protein LOC107530317 [Miniopterus natalensis]|uniref:uncharacterized protein LOC107530317 n=1 Tax=Miniopterus natalensis TaxID=291302 RepID=UPI0007A71FF8|nr:PREDICTED: uncharacterized protein LOC107530317 [Miniopterus natalensis]